MMGSAASPYRIFFAIIISIAFGIGLTVLIPQVISRGTFALLLLPVVTLFFLIMTVVPEQALALVLLFRAAFNPFIELSKSGDQQMGLGAGVNLVVILLLWILWMKTQTSMKGMKFFMFWIFFLTICFAAVIYSPQPYRALRLFMNFVTYMCMMVLPFMLIRTTKDKMFWLKCLLVSSVVPVIDGNFEFILSHGQLNRVFGTFSHPNIFAFYLVLMIVISYYLLRSKESQLSAFLRTVIKGYIVNLFVLLLLTKTRNAWIACWITFFLFGALADRKYLWITLALPPLALFVPALRERVTDLFQGNDISETSGLNSFAWRRRLWMESLVWVFKRPIQGYGLVSFLPLSQEFSDFGKKGQVGAHNTYLEILFESGLLGLTAFIGIWLSLVAFFTSRWKAVTSKLRWEYALCISYVIGYMVVCFADNMNYYLVFNWYSGFFIGIMAAWARNEMILAKKMKVTQYNDTKLLQRA